MTGGLIFKTEMYKFFTDKFYLISAAVLGVLNIIETVFFISLFYFEDSISGGPATFLMMLFPILVLANIFFMFIFPFHMVSVDYKNNVMALMMASGVNRTKLYFSKIGAIILCALIMGSVLFLIPTMIILIVSYSHTGINFFSEIFQSLFNIPDFPMFSLFFIMILAMINSVVMVLASAILLKGSNLTFLVYIGFNMGLNFIANFLIVLVAMSGSLTLTLVTIILFLAFSIAGFGALGFIMMRKQSL